MNVEDFQAIGFNRNEAIVYIAVIKSGEADAKSIIKETGFHKSIIYDNLEKLLSKGVISSIDRDGKRIFYIERANALLDFMQNEEDKAINRKDQAKKLVTEINKARSQNPIEVSATLFHGIAGVKQVFQMQLDSRENYISFGAPQASVDIFGEYFWKNFSAKQKELGLKGRLIFNESLRNWEGRPNIANNKFRFFGFTTEPMTQTIVFGNTTAIIVWSSKPSAMVINDPNVAKSYKDFFEILWKSAK